MERVEKIWLTDDAVWIRTADGKEACEKFVEYPRLRYATNEQRANYVATEDGLHWYEINEDLSFDVFFEKKKTTLLYKVFNAHPELNVSAVARRIGFSQSLMAQYISGKKKASDARIKLILDTIRLIGQELITV